MTRYLISALIAVALIFFISGVRTQEVEDETEFEYNDGPRGPAHWGELNETWKTCGNGTRQSPIDLVQSKTCRDQHTLHIAYHPAHATLINRGHDIMVNWTEDAGSIIIDSKEFCLKQCHWHSPAEHTLDGQQHPLEAHLVHQAADGEIAVIGIIYEKGDHHDYFLGELMDGILAIADQEPPDAEVPLGIVNPDNIQFDISKYYRYDGSLTTPACSEGVIWTVIYQVKTVFEGQVSALKNAVHDGYDMNARPIQAINERTVTLYTPTAYDCTYVS